MKPKLLKHIWRPTFSDSIISILVCTGLALGAYFLHRNLNQRSNSTKGERIGILIVKRNIVQRKLANQIIWEHTAEKKFPLYNQDTVRTGESSSALLRLNDKTEIDLDEDTLLVMDIVNKEANVNFARGSIRIKREEGSAGLKELKVHSKNHVVSLDKANLNLKAAENTDKLDVLVNSGKAAILSAEGEEYSVDKNEQISFKEGESEFRKIPISLKSPPDGYRFTFNGKGKKIEQTFQWELEKNTRPEYFEISRSSNFNSILVKRPARGRQIKLSLGEGNYYWRLSFFSIGVRERQYTSNFKLSLIANNVFLRGFAIQKSEASSQADLGRPPVSFSWNEIPSADSYILELSRDPNLSRVMESYKRQRSGLNLKLAVGEYYWRIKARSATEGQSIESKIYTLKVYKPQKKEKAFSVASLFALLKGKGAKTSSKNVAAPPKKLDTAQSLSLVKTPKTEPPKAKLSKAESPKIELLNGIELPKTEPKEVIKEPPAKLKKKKQEEKKEEKTQIVTAPILQKPRKGYTVHPLVIESKGLLFSWKMDPKLDSAVLMIAKNSSFSKKVHEETFAVRSSENQARVQIVLEPGLYYWRIRGLKASQPNSPFSEIYSFTVIGKGVYDLVLKEPKDELFFFPSDGPKISFVWKGIDGGKSYQFQLARDRNFRSIMHKLVTESTQLSVPRPKKDGKYYWRVRLVQEGISIAKSAVRIVGVLNSSSYIELRNGEKVRGRILKVDGDYIHIVTPQGKKRYSADEVADVSY